MDRGKGGWDGNVLLYGNSEDFWGAVLRGPKVNGVLDSFVYIAGGFIGEYFGAAAINKVG